MDRIETDGLHGFRPRKPTSLPPMLPWTSIQRIDRRQSRFRTGQVLGLALGAIAGASIGGAAAEGDPDKKALPLIGLAVGGVTGGWLGGRIGDRIVHERPLYVASPSGSSSETVAATPAPAEAWVTEVRNRIKPGQLMRVTGDFGQFSGRAAEMGEQGLSGLQPDPAFVSTVPLPSEPVSWARISRVERRGNRSTGGAVVGGVASGVVFGYMVAGMSEWLGPTTTAQKARGFVGGFLIGGLIGGGVGALIGAMVPRWQRVHP